MPASALAVLYETDTVSAYREWAETSESQAVHCWWEQRIPARTDQNFVQRLLPDGHSDVIIFADGRAMVVGPTMDVALPQLTPATHLWGLRLKTEALAVVLGCPDCLLRDANLPLNAVISNGLARELAESIWNRCTPRWVRDKQVDGRVRLAAHHLRHSQGTDVATVASHCRPERETSPAHPARSDRNRPEILVASGPPAAVLGARRPEVAGRQLWQSVRQRRIRGPSAPLPRSF